MPGINYGDIISTTLKLRSGGVANNFENNNAFMASLKKRGNIVKVDGGEALYETLAYQANSTVSSYSGYDILNTTPQNILDMAAYQWKQTAGSISMSGLEKLKNSGKSAIKSLIKERVKNLEGSIRNNLETQLFSDGTGNGGKDIGGLQHIVADTNTNTVGAISGSTYSFWRNEVLDASSSTAGAVSNANISQHLNDLWMSLVRGEDSPTDIFADNLYWGFYHDSLTDIQRITSEKNSASSGFTQLAYKINIPVYLVGGKGGACPASHLYMLNMDYLKLQVHKDQYLEPLSTGGRRNPVNQDAFIDFIGFAGNLTCSNRSLQGVLKA
jgi:hypothetical protein